MFTGIVEDVGTVLSVSGDAAGRSLRIRSAIVTEDLSVGDSISIAGACLTAVSVDGDAFEIEAVSETLERTNLGRLQAGDGVNLERAMRADGRFDGHIVQGHVDGVGRVVRLESEGIGSRLAIDVPPGLLRWIVEKGSITVDGVSLTVAHLSGQVVEIALIPHTLEATTLGSVSAGDGVNVEADILGKYVERLMEKRT